MEENKLFDCNQYQDFEINILPERQSSPLVEKVSRALDTGKMVVGVFLDFQKSI